ncbi:hypothetical protein SpCBS45565_g08213 [Spizellomyces sp. 'palustris']|nr:hypothetical protein SpCBS45565_g08213 [Spizellomyces sp. 'palustris']
MIQQAELSSSSSSSSSPSSTSSPLSDLRDTNTKDAAAGGVRHFHFENDFETRHMAELESGERPVYSGLEASQGDHQQRSQPGALAGRPGSSLPAHQYPHLPLPTHASFQSLSHHSYQHASHAQRQSALPRMQAEEASDDSSSEQVSEASPDVHRSPVTASQQPVDFGGNSGPGAYANSPHLPRELEHQEPMKHTSIEYGGAQQDENQRSDPSYQQSLHGAAVNQISFPAGFNPSARRRSLSAPPGGLAMHQLTGESQPPFPEFTVNSIGIPVGMHHVGDPGRGMHQGRSYTMHPGAGFQQNRVQRSAAGLSIIPPMMDPHGSIPSPPQTPVLSRSPGPQHVRYHPGMQNTGPLPSVNMIHPTPMYMAHQPNLSYHHQMHPSMSNQMHPVPSSQVHPRVHHLIYDHSNGTTHPSLRSSMEMDASPRYPTPPPRSSSAPVMHGTDMAGPYQPHTYHQVENVPHQAQNPMHGAPAAVFADHPHHQMQPHPAFAPNDPRSPHQQQSSPPTPRRLYKCPKPFCTKTYKNANGLKYHLDRGMCEYDTASPPFHPPPPQPHNHQPMEIDVAAAGHVKIAHRPYWCKVPGCGKKYKNLNGLKYHAKAVHPELDFRSEVKGALLGA